SLLWYRMGDFYELFFDDASIASAALGIVLTKRGRHQGTEIPMCGVPVHRSDEYLQRLIRQVDPNGNNVALKVYLTSTSSFKKRAPYIVGDPRFSHLKKGTRNMVYLWAQKEFKNLKQCVRHGLPVVKPLHVSKNVLAMEFVGEAGVPAPTLHETEVDENDYAQIIDFIKKLYKKAKLVHGDLSEFNVFKTKNGILVFDFGSAVDTIHPNAQNFLERDIKNVSYFFAKRGLTVTNPADILQTLIS
ncbi:MAG: RIO1 family regulatory kinase/ATPase, partial [Candidatus Nitrosotenuis sp.]